MKSRAVLKAQQKAPTPSSTLGPTTSFSSPSSRALKTPAGPSTSRAAPKQTRHETIIISSSEDDDDDEEEEEEEEEVDWHRG